MPVAAWLRAGAHQCHIAHLHAGSDWRGGIKAFRPLACPPSPPSPPSAASLERPTAEVLGDGNGDNPATSPPAEGARELGARPAKPDPAAGCKSAKGKGE